MSTVRPALRYRSLAFGIAYLLGAVLAGFNLDLVWDTFAPDDVRGQSRHLVSVLTIVFPHIVAIAGFVLLIVDTRLSGRVFALVALVPFVYFLVCVYLRTTY